MSLKFSKKFRKWGMNCNTAPSSTVIVITIIIMLSPVTGLFSLYFSSWTNGDPHRSGFKFQTAVLSVLCVMFQVQLSFVVNLLNVFLLWLPNSLNICYHSGGSNYYWYNHITCSALIVSLHRNSSILNVSLPTKCTIFKKTNIRFLKIV